MGAYWCDDSDTPTELGELIAAAKDHESQTALNALKSQLSNFVCSLNLHSAATCAACGSSACGSSACRIVVVPVPNGLGRKRRLAPVLASSAAEAMGAPLREAVLKRNATVRLRDTPVEHRLALVESAGFEVTGSVADLQVVLVDDVVLTGTTLAHLAGLLKQAGAASVSAVVAARARHADQAAGHPD